jgi:hypothetical protein
VDDANTAALVGAGLLSVILFPPVAVGLLRDAGDRGATAPAVSG